MKIKKISITFFLIVCAFGLNAQTIQEKIAECEKYWDPEVLERANTAKDADYLSEVSKQSIYFANLARFNGHLFGETFMAAFCSDWYTNESETFKTLKEDLDKSIGLFPLRPDKYLSRAAQSHAEDDKKQAHTSGDGTGCTHRVVVIFNCWNYGAENIAWGRYENGIQPTIQWLIDNGQAPNYGHRRHLLGPGYTNLGVGLSCNPSDGGCCMVHDFGRYNDDDVLEYIYKTFPERLIKIADVARDVDYLAKKEKDLIMIANIARLDLRLFVQKVLKDFTPEPDSDLISFVESKYDKPMYLLYPDRQLQNAAYELAGVEDFVPFDPKMTDTKDNRRDWYRHYYGPADYWRIMRDKANFDDVNYAVGLKGAFSPTKSLHYYYVVSHSKSNEGWDYKLTSELYRPSPDDKPNPNNYDEDVSDYQPPVLIPATEDKPLHFLIDAQTDDGDYDPDDEEYEYDDEEYEYDDEEYDSDDDE